MALFSIRLLLRRSQASPAMVFFMKQALLVAILLGTVSSGLAGTLCQAPPASAGFPPVRLESLVKGLRQPVGLVHAGDGSGRLFVVEQGGLIRIITRGEGGEQSRLQDKPFVDLREKVAMGYEMGLLGLAFHPQFRANGRLFVNYTTRREGIQTVIAEFQVSPKQSRVDRAAERVLLTVAQPYPNHKGGHLAFGPDGLLYIGLGDGGSANDPQNRAQDLMVLLGKMLRIDVDQRSPERPYGISRDNPFVGRADARPEVWAYGLRNPWRYSFDAETGLLYVGDVGQNDREEIDVVRQGKNYGWRLMEGSICTPAVGKDCDRAGLELPILDYPTRRGNVVIGGMVYRGTAIPELCGAYVYADYGTGRISALRYDGQRVVATGTLLETKRAVSSFGEDEEHELHVVDYAGEVLKLLPVESVKGQAAEK
jgi:glucose/arabinose dehydrogenase